METIFCLSKLLKALSIFWPDSFSRLIKAKLEKSLNKSKSNIFDAFTVESANASGPGIQLKNVANVNTSGKSFCGDIELSFSGVLQINILTAISIIQVFYLSEKENSDAMQGKDSEVCW